MLTDVEQENMASNDATRKSPTLVSFHQVLTLSNFLFSLLQVLENTSHEMS